MVVCLVSFNSVIATNIGPQGGYIGWVQNNLLHSPSKGMNVRRYGGCSIGPQRVQHKLNLSHVHFVKFSVSTES